MTFADRSGFGDSGLLEVTAGATAAFAHFAQNEDGLGDPAYLVNLSSIIILLLLISGDIRPERLLPKWSFTPTYLAWALVLQIPLGAAFEAIDERLLEIPLLGAPLGGRVGCGGIEPGRNLMQLFDQPAQNGTYALVSQSLCLRSDR